LTRETNLQDYAPHHLSTWSEDLKSLVKAFHDKGWVHGDLRDAKFIVNNQKPGQVMLIDFDWGGDINAGQVYYPTALVNEELLKSEHLDDFEITKEHDDASTLEKLGASG